MTWTWIQGATADQSATVSTASLTFGSPVVANGLVGGFVGYAGSTNPLSGIADDKGNAYFFGTLAGTTNYNFAWYYLNGISNGPTTLTFSFLNGVGTSSFIHMTGDVYTGGLLTGTGLNASALNQLNATSTAPDFLTSGPITTTTDGCLILAGLIDTSGSDATNTGTGFTLRQSGGGGIYKSEDLVQSAAGSTAGTFTATLTGDNFIVAAMALLPPPPPPPPSYNHSGILIT